MSIWTDDAGRIHVAIMRDGRRIHRRMPKGASKGDAKQVEAEIRQALGRREVHIPGDPAMSVVMQLYLDHATTLRSPDTARFHALRAGPWCEGRRASAVEQMVDHMVSDMREHYAAGTINKTIGTIKTACTLAWRKRITPENYGTRIRRIAENNQRHVYLSLDQVTTLASHASDNVKTAIWIALLTGCRRGEILKLQPADVQGNTLRILAGNTKTLRERHIPIIAPLRPWLDKLPLPINAEGLKTGFYRAREKAGMPHIHFHDLRHSTASLLINMGVSLEVIRDILGHTTVKTTERYSHLLIDRQREALEKLAGAISVQNTA